MGGQWLSINSAAMWIVEGENLQFAGKPPKT